MQQKSINNLTKCVHSDHPSTSLNTDDTWIVHIRGLWGIMIYLSKYNFFKNPDFLHTHLGSFKGLNKTPVNKGLVGMQYYYYFFFSENIWIFSNTRPIYGFWIVKNGLRWAPFACIRWRKILAKQRLTHSIKHDILSRKTEIYFPVKCTPIIFIS